MYMPDTEDIYLLYATCMILNNAKGSNFSDEPIFQNPLPSARFDAEYQNIDTSWQNVSSMMPLFRATQEKPVSRKVAS
jgi:DNA-dependent protein kinase catalytic subunit